MPRVTRTKIALEWAIDELLDRATSPCGFYLITIPELMPWDEVAERHRSMLHLMALHVKRKRLKPYGGVRVFEEGEQTNRPHAHWVMCPRIPQDRIQWYASMAGMGQVWLDQRPAGEALGSYLAKYMAKSQSMKGRRRWQCFGAFKASVQVGQVQVDTEHTRAFKAGLEEAKRLHMGKSEAYTFAARAANLQKYGITEKDRWKFMSLSGGRGSITTGESGLETSDRGTDLVEGETMASLCSQGGSSSDGDDKSRGDVGF